MLMKREFSETYGKLLKEDEILPSEWIPFYQVTACLKDSANKRTYLLKEKTENTYFLLKVAKNEEAVHLYEEGKLLQDFQKREDSLKAQKENEIWLKELLQKDNTVYLLRNYVDGIPLAERGELHGFSQEEMIHIGIMLCEEVKKLHLRKPPVIHRDIKPENIIIREDGRLVLIDFETARVYKEGKREDTYFAGTRDTAAPEQFGFGQSDERTDIYGIGKTLLYMVTRDYDLQELGQISGNKKLNRLIQKCCSFEPDKRYPSVERLRMELKKCLSDSRKEKKTVRALVALVVLLCFAVLILGAQVIALRAGSGKGRAESSSDAGAQTGNGEPIPDSGEKNYSSRILCSGWDVTDYDLLLEQVMDCCERKDYDALTEQCRQIVARLYEDEFLQKVKPEDTYYYLPEDERWEAYHITRMGYELAADHLAYHDRMLERELDHFEEYQYYIAMAVREMAEATEEDEDGNIHYTLLYQYNSESSAGKADVDYSISCLLDAIICGIENYHTENS